MTTPPATREPGWPVGLVAIAAALFFVASLRYPGGYDWASQSISSLFQPLSAGGDPNPARPLAVASVLSFCIGVAAVFHRLSLRAASRRVGKTIQIAGIGSMVYAFLVVTPMHDVLVGVSLAFFLVAMLAVYRLLWSEGRLGLMAAGVVCLAGTLWNAALYYGPFQQDPLPVVQKGSMLLWVTWLCVLYFSPGRRTPVTS